MSEHMQTPMVVFPGIPTEKVTADAVAVAFGFLQLCAQRETPGPTGEIRELTGDDRAAKQQALRLLATYWDERSGFLEKVVEHREACEKPE
jgi:hypothetical protein